MVIGKPVWVVLMIPAALAAFVGVLLLAIGMFGGGALVFIAGVVLLVPMAILLYLERLYNTLGRDRFEQVASEFGATQRWWGERTGIALSSKNSKVVLASDGTLKTYDFSDIRAWRSSLDTSFVVAGTGAAAAGAQVGMGLRRMANTGVFVTVKDIDHPEWHVRIRKNLELNRWYELMTQVVNEGAKI
jgi:hypothetical protein